MAVNASSLFASSFLLLAVKLVQRSMGLISTLILARLLTPADFGVVAIAAIVVHLFRIMAVSGSDQYIIQKSEVDSADLNTAWSIDIFLKMLVWLVIIIAADGIDLFFKDVEVAAVIRCLSIILFFESLQNPALMILRKEQKYRKIFLIEITAKSLSFVLVISLAFIFKSYWAIITGDIVFAFSLLVGSYYIKPYKPYFTFEKFKEQFQFSRWILMKGILGYLRGQIDSIIVSRTSGAELLGKYYMARDIALLPANEIIKPMLEPILASFSSIKKDKLYLARQVRVSFMCVFAITVTISCYIFFFPQYIIDTILGKQWQSVYGIFSNLSLLFFSISIGSVFSNALVSLKKVRFLFYYDLFSLLGICLSLLIFRNTQLEFFALLVGILFFICSSVQFAFLSIVLPINAKRALMLSIPFLAVPLFSAYIVSHFSLPTISAINLVWSGGLFVGLTAVLDILIIWCFSSSCEEYGYVMEIIHNMTAKILSRYSSNKKLT